jgi:hypothetical protein
MNNVNVKNRLDYLINTFNVFEKEDDIWTLDYSTKSYISGNKENVLDNLLAILLTSEVSKVDSNGDEILKFKKVVYIASSVFDLMVESDPSKNKMYTQWMLNVFTKLIKNGDVDDAVRFAREDLPLAKEYLEIFEANKRKKRFREYCEKSFILKDIKDVTNINQYKSLSQLYDAVDPFIIRDPSEIELSLQRFVELGEAEIPVRDRKFTIFKPKTTEASVIFDKFVSWCTASPGNGMFKSYTQNNKKPNGENSDIYIVINNEFFNGELRDNYLYQIHFETSQVRNRKQASGSNFVDDVLFESENVSNYFLNELTNLARMEGKVKKSKYVDYLVRFGWTEALFDLIDDFTPLIMFEDIELIKLSDMTKFTNLHSLVIVNTKLRELHDSVGSLSTLREMIIKNNKISKLPSTIGKLKNLIFLNLVGNQISYIPDEIKFLDESNGGSLFRLAVKREEIGENNYQKLKKLLPNVRM